MLKDLLAKMLRETANKVETGCPELTDGQIIECMSILSEFDNSLWMNKDQACSFMNMSRSTFDANVRCGLIPQGQKMKGWKEKVWFKCQLDDSKKEIELVSKITTKA